MVVELLVTFGEGKNEEQIILFEVKISFHA